MGTDLDHVEPPSSVEVDYNEIFKDSCEELHANNNERLEKLSIEEGSFIKAVHAAIIDFQIAYEYYEKAKENRPPETQVYYFLKKNLPDYENMLNNLKEIGENLDDNLIVDKNHIAETLGALVVVTNATNKALENASVQNVHTMAEKYL